MTLHVYSREGRGVFLCLSSLADGSCLFLCCSWVCLCERVYVHSVFRDLLERINNKRVKQSQRLAVCFIVMFLPYVFVPAGRSCFWLPKLIGLIVHPVNQKMQSRRPVSVSYNRSVLWFFFFDEDLFACLWPEGGSRVPPFSGRPRQPLALAGLVALLQDIIQHRFHSINVLYSMCCSPA